MKQQTTKTVEASTKLFKRMKLLVRNQPLSNRALEEKVLLSVRSS